MQDKNARSFHVDDWKTWYGSSVTTRHFDILILDDPCPFEPEKKIRDTHFFFVGVRSFLGEPLTIMRWHTISKQADHPRLFGGNGPYWYEETDVARKSTCNEVWYAVYRRTVLGSDKQVPYTEAVQIKQFVPDGYRIPRGIELLTAQLLHLRKYNLPLLASTWAWSSDAIGLDHHMIVGHYERSAVRGMPCIRINANWNREERGSVGIMPIREI